MSVISSYHINPIVMNKKSKFEKKASFKWSNQQLYLNTAVSHQGSSVLLCVMLPSNMGIKSPKPTPYYFQKRLFLEGQSTALRKEWCPGRSSVICFAFRGFQSVWSSTAHSAGAEAVEGSSDEYILQTNSALQLLRQQFFYLYFPLFKTEVLTCF